MASLTNKIIANIKQSTNNNQNFYNTENVICIDSSFIRFGINTKNPQYAIDVSGDDNVSIINSKNLIITNLGTIKNIDSSKAYITDLSVNIIDISSFCSFYEISGIIANINTLNANNSYISEFSANSISCDYLDVIYDICSDNLQVNSITTNSITINEKLDFSYNLIANNLTVETSGSIPILDTSNITNSNIINTTILYSSTISCEDLFVEAECSFNNLFIESNLEVSGDAFFNLIDVSDGSFNNISSENITIVDTLYVNELKSICGETLIDSDGTIQDTRSNFNNINVKNYINLGLDNSLNYETNISMLNIYGQIYIDHSNNNLSNIASNINFSAKSKFILPLYNQNYYDNSNSTGTIAYDAPNSLLKIKHNNENEWREINTKKRVATFKLNTSISGNDISENIHAVGTDNKFFIENSNNLIITYNNKNYKYIPLTFNKHKITEISNIDHNSDDSIFNTDISSLLIGISNENSRKNYLCENSNNYIDYELTTNLTLEFLNKNPNDVEVTSYTYGIYPSIEFSNNTINDISYIINNPFIEVKNTIIVFDNSYNYSNINLTYTGTLGNSDLSNLTNNYIINNGFKFFITSAKDIDLQFLRIESFYATIKQV